jgi:hypothetical protein
MFSETMKIMTPAETRHGHTHLASEPVNYTESDNIVVPYVAVLANSNEL